MKTPKKQLKQSVVPPPDAALLTVPEAASALRRSTSCIRAWILHRRIPHVKIGAGVFIRRSDIDLLMAKVVPAGKQAVL